jgi:hypothetical protein
MTTLFSLTLPLLEAVDDIQRPIGKYRKLRQHSDGSSPDERNEPKRQRFVPPRYQSLQACFGTLRASVAFVSHEATTGPEPMTKTAWHAGIQHCAHEGTLTWSIQANGTIPYPSAGSRRERYAQS